MEGHVWVVLLMTPREDPALSRMNRHVSYKAIEITPVPVTDWETSKETLIDPSQCLETGEVTIIQDCLQGGHCRAVGTGNTGRAGVWTQAIWLHSLHPSQAHHLRLW